MFNFLMMFFFIPIKTSLNTDWSIFTFSSIPVTVTIATLTLDTLISLNSGYFKNGEIMTDRVYVIDNYIRNIMIVDYISIIVLVTDLFNGNNNTFLLPFFFLQLNRFNKINIKIEESVNLKDE
jgi:hypothetical protein